MARGKSAVATDAGDSDKPRFDEFIVIYLIKRLVYDKCLWEEDSPTGTLMSLVWEKEKSEDVTEKRKNLIAIIGSVNGTSFQSSSFSLQSIMLQFRIEVFHA